MSQTPHPHDPYGTEPGAPDSQQSAPQAAEQGSPTSDPALHPHDPFAYDVAPEPSAQQAAADPYGQSQYTGQAPHAEQPQHAEHAQYTGQAPYSAPHAAPGGDGPDQPAPGTPGVYEGALTGQPMSRSDSRMWAMFSQLSAVLGHVVSWGALGWVGPLIIFIIYKDRDRLVRHHAAEALNGAISVVIAAVGLSIVLGIFAVITLGIGSFLLALVPVPALIHVIFAIVGAVKANQGEYWKYPLNIRLVK